MSRFKILAVPIALICFMGMNMFFIGYAQDLGVAIKQSHLASAVNYAIDASIDDLVGSTSDVLTDYGDYESIIVDPDAALDSFLTVLLKNYNMALSEENKVYVKTSFLKAFIIATYDGYFIGYPMKINSAGAYDIVFTDKQAYTYEKDGTLFALNLGLKDVKAFSNGVIVKEESKVYGLTESEQQSIINGQVSDAFMKIVWEQLNGAVVGSIFIPSEMTSVKPTNSINSVTVMAYVSDWSVGVGSPLQVYSIGGSRIVHNNNVAAYERDGVLYYMYPELLPDTVEIIEMFPNPQAAAEKGYYYDAYYGS